MSDRIKATIHLVVEIPFEVTDGGYLGSSTSSLEEHIKAAKDHVQRHQVYLKSNTDHEPKLVRNAVMRVKEVVITP